MFESALIRLFAPVSANLPGKARQEANVEAEPVWEGEAWLRHLRQEQALHRLGMAGRNTWQCRVSLPHSLLEDPTVGPPGPGWEVRATVEWRERAFKVISATAGTASEGGLLWNLKLEEPEG